MNHGHCQFKDDSGATCQEPALPSGLCYWHDPNVDKKSNRTLKELESYAQRGGQLRGIKLRYASLSGVDLVKQNSKTGYDMTGCDLYRADLSGGHLFNLTLREANLMKADLRGANIKWADCHDANLLGVKIESCKLEHAHIGSTLRQERQALAAYRAGDKLLALDYWQQAEEIYRTLRKACENEGLFAAGGLYLRKELTMRRYQAPLWSIRRATSKVVDLFCGYGEEPSRVVIFSMLLILVCAILYFFTGINFDGQLITYHNGNSSIENLKFFFECLYYSVVTFTTLGYGDFTPAGLSRFIAAVEAFTGSFTIALFVVVFVKKMTR